LTGTFSSGNGGGMRGKAESLELLLLDFRLPVVSLA